MKKVASYALGCKVNQYESESIAELFSEKGYEIVDIDEVADIYIINTCTVTNLGDKKSRQLIRKVKRQNPDSIVAAIGCYAQTASKEIGEIEGVNLVIGTNGRKEIVELVENYNKDMGVVSTVQDIAKQNLFEPLSIKKLHGRTRAYIKIQDGCSMYCTYCIIPYARGPVRSRNIEDIINEVKTLAENGFREIVLTGIHVASYGKDLKGISLLDVIKKVHEIDGIDRIRMSSLEPNLISEDFVREISKLPKVCDHFHLSLQSGSNKTLKAMNRKYDTAKFRNAAEILRKYYEDVALTTDVIVGFPGESDEDFIESYEFVKEIGFSKVHVFPYSPKKGTVAAVMNGQISNSVKKKRAGMLIDLSNALSETFISKFIGKNKSVLFEQSIGDDRYDGHTTNYIHVISESKEDIKNQIIDTEILSFEDENATGMLMV